VGRGGLVPTAGSGRGAADVAEGATDGAGRTEATTGGALDGGDVGASSGALGGAEATVEGAGGALGAGATPLASGADGETLAGTDAAAATFEDAADETLASSTNP
jgi:hypothetical protein